MVDGLLIRENRPLQFAGFTLDLDGCTLMDEHDRAVDLTRGELVMLRTFAQQPGRVLSRDALLDAVAGRRGDTFDRSVDMMVGRLRRKIEEDLKHPGLIVTVPGLGYKFAATVTVKEARPPALDLAGGAEAADTAAALPRAAPAAVVSGRRLVLLGGAAVAALAGGALWLLRGRGAVAHPVTITLLPFANISGDTAQDYFAEGVAIHLSIQLGTFPIMQVMAPPLAQAVRERGPIEAARGVGADYALQGEVLKGVDKVRITAQLFETRSGVKMWSDRFDASGTDLLAMQENIADRILSVAVRLAWGRVRNRDARGLEEGDAEPGRIRLRPARACLLPSFYET